MRASLHIKSMSSGTWFARFAKATARVSGHAATFGLAVLVIIAWAVTGPLFHFSDTWQLVINTGTTIVTFLMVFLIQNTQNRDSVAMQIKLDELLRAMKGAQTAMADLEDLTEAELDAFKAHYAELAAAARSRMRGEGRMPFAEESADDQVGDTPPRDGRKEPTD
jgi:low affinity Fe/Cu permease